MAAEWKQWRISRATFTWHEHSGMYEHLVRLIESRGDNLFPPLSQLAPPPGLILADDQLQIPQYAHGQRRHDDVEKEVYNNTEKEAYFAHSGKIRERIKSCSRNFLINIKKKRYWVSAMAVVILVVAVGVGVGVGLNGKKSDRSSATAAAATTSNLARCAS